MKKGRYLLLVLLLLLSGCGIKKDASKDVKFKHGVVEANVYQNSSIHLSIQIPDGFYADSDEELAKNMNIATDEMKDIEKLLGKDAVFYDASFTKPEVPITNMVILMNMDANPYLRSIDMSDNAAFLNGLKKSLKEAGGTSITAGTEMLGGYRYGHVKGVLPIQGYNVVNEQYYRKHGQYTICLSFMYIEGADDEAVQQLKDGYSKI